MAAISRIQKQAGTLQYEKQGERNGYSTTMQTNKERQL